jgi:hypothetical protein
LRLVLQDLKRICSSFDVSARSDAAEIIFGILVITKETKMLRSSQFRFIFIVLVCAALAAAPAQAQIPSNFGDIGISKGAAVAIIIGGCAVVAATVLIVYHAIPKQKTIEGCVESADNKMMVRGRDRKTYILEGDAASIKPGQHVKVKGKKSKDKSGTLRLNIRKVVKDFGPCTPTNIH